MRTEDFSYELPKELIAQAPASPRDSCRMLVLNKATGVIAHKHFYDVIGHLNPGDVLVANETRVMPARLIGHKAKTGGAAEVFLLNPRADGTWEALVKPGRRLQAGAIVEFPCAQDPNGEIALRARILGHSSSRGGRIVALEPVGNMSADDAIHAAGRVPLPPYITQYDGDPEQYQTVYSRRETSAAAPTAGLHFSRELLDRIEQKGVAFETVELEVGVDTFRLVDEDDPRDHKMHTERYTVSQRVVDAVREAHERGNRVIAVGTTSVRSLESAYDPHAKMLVAKDYASTSLYILPGYEFKVIDALITNFHVPRSTLLMLVSALAGRENIMAAYEQAVEMRYRFFSFGDAMLIE